MTPSTPAADAAAAMVALQVEIERLASARQTQSDLRTAAIVRRAQGSDDAALADEIASLGASVAALDAEIAGAREALSQLEEVAPALAEREAAAAAEAAMQRAKKNAAAVRRAANAVDEAANALGAAVADLRAALATLSTDADADAGVRATDGFEMLAYHVGTLQSVIQQRLADLGVMPGRSPFIDRSAPPRSIRAEIDRAIYGLLPLQGRPKAASDS